MIYLDSFEEWNRCSYLSVDPLKPGETHAIIGLTDYGTQISVPKETLCVLPADLDDNNFPGLAYPVALKGAEKWPIDLDVENIADTQVPTVRDFINKIDEMVFKVKFTDEWLDDYYQVIECPELLNLSKNYV